MSDFKMSRSFFVFIENVFWLGLMAGLFIAYSGWNVTRQNGTIGWTMAFAGTTLTALSVLGVVLAQMGRAQVQTANLTGELLIVARTQLDVARQMLDRTPASEVPSPSSNVSKLD